MLAFYGNILLGNLSGMGPGFYLLFPAFYIVVRVKSPILLCPTEGFSIKAALFLSYLPGSYSHLIFNIFLFFILTTLFYFIFLSFFLFLPFLLSHVADRVLVLRLGVRPEPLRWESR